MEKELTVLKLGGSLLTDKSQPYVVRDEILRVVTEEIRECIDEGFIQSLVVVHGVGSYGHPPVLEHKLHRGYQGPEQLMPLSKTQAIVDEFRAMIVTQFQDSGIPVCLMHPSSMITSEKMVMTEYFLDSLKGYVSLGMSILLGGDILIDSVMGFSVGSGDQLAVIIAKELGAKRLLLATDVAGIYDADPKTNPDAKLIPEVNLNNIDHVLEQMGRSGSVDASGAMKGKLSSIAMAKQLIENGLEAAIFSMMEKGNLVSLLRGDDVKATRFVSK